MKMKNRDQFKINKILVKKYQLIFFIEFLNRLKMDKIKNNHFNYKYKVN